MRQRFPTKTNDITLNFQQLRANKNNIRDGKLFVESLDVSILLLSSTLSAFDSNPHQNICCITDPFTQMGRIFPV